MQERWPKETCGGNRFALLNNNSMVVRRCDKYDPKVVFSKASCDGSSINVVDIVFFMVFEI